jgi:hypothetical protein
MSHWIWDRKGLLALLDEVPADIGRPLSKAVGHLLPYGRGSVSACKRIVAILRRGLRQTGAREPG